MTDPTAIRDRLGLRYPGLVSYLDTESLIAQLQRDLADAEALASAQKPEYIAALKAEIARLEGTPPAVPERISEPEATDEGVTCACGRVFEKIAQWRGHQYKCPARVKKVEPSCHCECGEVFATARSLNLHRRHCTPEPIVWEVAPGFTVNTEGEYQCNCGGPHTQSLHDPLGRCIECFRKDKQ